MEKLSYFGFLGGENEDVFFVKLNDIGDGNFLVDSIMSSQSPSWVSTFPSDVLFVRSVILIDSSSKIIPNQIKQDYSYNDFSDGFFLEKLY